jgi:hypothetical protein
MPSKGIALTVEQGQVLQEFAEVPYCMLQCQKCASPFFLCFLSLLPVFHVKSCFVQAPVSRNHSETHLSEGCVEQHADS